MSGLAMTHARALNPKSRRGEGKGTVGEKERVIPLVSVARNQCRIFLAERDQKKKNIPGTGKTLST